MFVIQNCTLEVSQRDVILDWHLYNLMEYW